MTLEFYPPSLSVVVNRGGRGMRHTEVAVYCKECEGTGEYNENFGNFLAYHSLLEAIDLSDKHDVSHHMAIVDVGNCGFGLW